MITDIRITKSLQVAQDNNLFKLVPESSCVPLSSLSSISFLAVAPPGCVEISKFRCVKACVKLLKDKLNNYSMWLLSSTTTWRPDSAIANHFKLWKLLKKRGYSLSSEFTQEISVKSHDVVKFFGAAKLKESELEIGLKILSVEKMSFLILLPNVRNADLHGYVDKRWESANEHDYSFWTAVIAHTCCNRGVFLRVFGWFDDREVGVTSVMPRHLFESVFL